MGEVGAEPRAPSSYEALDIGRPLGSRISVLGVTVILVGEDPLHYLAPTFCLSTGSRLPCAPGWP